MANSTCLFFGSDVAYDPMEPLWGPSFTSSTGSSCDHGRDDLKTLREMGVTLIRLYDWEPRNKHVRFLDRCEELGIKVLAPISAYFLKEGFPLRHDRIPELIRSFSNESNTDYHPAVAGIIVGNEPRLSQYSVSECIELTKSFVDIEHSAYSGYRPVIIGHPVDFAPYGGQYPCWGFWDPLVESLESVSTRDLNERLFLAPQSYNGKSYLFENAEGSGKGYVDLTFERYQRPLLFTEIGMDRTKPGYLDTIDGQLGGSIAYAGNHSNALLGACFFQFADKVWMQGTSEGSFGAFSHTSNVVCTVSYGNEDFTHWEHDGSAEQLHVDELSENPVHDVVVRHFRPS